MTESMIRETTVNLEAKDGHEFDCYQFQTHESNAPGLIVLHEIFGMTKFIKNMCRLWAQKGYQVVAPALYDRLEKNIAIPYTDEDCRKALDYQQRALNWDNQLLDIEATKIYLQKQGVSNIAVLGYSWGGTLSWLSACRLSGIRCAISYYGTDIFQFKNEIPKCPSLLHFATRDNLVPAQHINAIKALHPDIPIHLYNATHGFRCEEWNDTHKQKYNAKASLLADKLTLNFLSTITSQTIS